MQSFARAVILTTVTFLLTSGPVAAQTIDHLQCYKVKDPHRYRAEVHLLSPQFGVTRDCKVKVRGTKFCVPASKFVVSTDAPATVLDGEGLEFDRICYKVKCSRSGSELPEPTEVSDQFGTRTIEFRPTFEICTPAVKGAPPAAAVCGNGSLESGEACEFDTDCVSPSTCSAHCNCVHPQCPTVVEWNALAGLGVQTTSTEEDQGWTGFTHNTDQSDGARVNYTIECGGTGNACAQCEITGVDPSPRNCRCANDNRLICNEPFAADNDDCGGATCQCYLSPPHPRVDGNTPRCLLDRLATQTAGTWNVDTGTFDMSLDTRRVVFLGNSLTIPCPTCAGDATPGDGNRDGVCVGGENDGQNCDVDGADASFPAPGGGEYSYDCFPDAGKNVSGVGVAAKYDVTTGSVSQPSLVECGFPPFALEQCPCGRCSTDTSAPCRSDADCFSSNGGFCENAGGTRPNACTSGNCVDQGAGEGRCDAAGPDDQFCDAILRADGRGFIACLTNVDCAPGTIGVNAGVCTLTERRACFLDPVQGTGVPSPSQPLTVGFSCMAGTGSAGINSVSGLPGPVRVRLEGQVTFVCSNPAFTYPGCP